MRALISTALAVAAVVCGATGSASEDLLQVGGKAVKWASSRLRTPAIITYAVLEGHYAISRDKETLSRDNCTDMLPFSHVIAGSPGILAATAKQQLRQAFLAWESVAAVTFVAVEDVSRANIVVGASSAGMGRAFANLSYRGAGSHTAPTAMALGGIDHSRLTDRVGVVIDRAYICLNPKARWKVGFDGNLDVYDLRYTFMHEIGHAIGLDHPGTTGAIMAYRYDERVRSLQESDIDAVRVLYGPPHHTK